MTKNVEEKSIGQVIRERRIELKMQSQELAEKAGSTRTYISDIEHERKTPGINVLFRISKALEINLEDLISRSNFNEVGENKTREV